MATLYFYTPRGAGRLPIGAHIFVGRDRLLGRRRSPGWTRHPAAERSAKSSPTLGAVAAGAPPPPEEDQEEAPFWLPLRVLQHTCRLLPPLSSLPALFVVPLAVTPDTSIIAQATPPRVIGSLWSLPQTWHLLQALPWHLTRQVQVG